MCLRYRYNCVSPKSLRELNYIIDNSRIITYETFLKYVNRNDLLELSKNLGHSRRNTNGITLKGDWSVTYHKSKLPNGQLVYYLSYSAIEYIFY